MRSLFNRLSLRFKSFNRSQQFVPSFFSLLTNPTYIIKRGLYLAIRTKSLTMTGDLLDVGCGSAPYRGLFKVRSYTGIDVILNPIANLRSYEYSWFDGINIPFASGRYDCVLATEVFEHVFNLPSLLKEVARVSKEEATLLCTLPFVWPEHDEPFDFARYTSFGITDLFEKAGYEVIEVKRHGTYTDVIIQLILIYLDTQYRKIGILGLIPRVLTCTALNFLAIGLNALLPNVDKLYLGLVIEARLRKSVASPS